MVDQVAYKMSPQELKEAGLNVNKAAYRIPTLNEVIRINHGSVLREKKPKWIVYQEVYQQDEKLYARGTFMLPPLYPNWKILKSRSLIFQDNQKFVYFGDQWRHLPETCITALKTAEEIFGKLWAKFVKKVIEILSRISKIREF